MKTKFEVSVSNGSGDVVVFNTTANLAEATQLALALHQSSSNDVVVDVFIEGCAPGDPAIVHLFKSVE